MALEYYILVFRILSCNFSLPKNTRSGNTKIKWSLLFGHRVGGYFENEKGLDILSDIGYILTNDRHLHGYTNRERERGTEIDR